MEASSSTSVNPAAQTGTVSLTSFGSAGNYVVIGVTAKNRADSGGVNPITSLTYGGVTKTPVGSAFGFWNAYGFHTTLYVFEAGAGAIDVHYTMNEDNDHDSMGIVAARYSGVGGFAGLATAANPLDNLEDNFSASLTTTVADSMIVAAFGIGNPNGILSITNTGGSAFTAVIPDEDTSAKATTALFELSAATVGNYDFVGKTTDDDRGALIAVELVPGAAGPGPADLWLNSLAQDQVERGTTTNILLVIENNGTAATNVIATLTTTDSASFTVNSPITVNTATFGAGGQVTNTFSITASNGIPIGATNAFSLVLSGYGTDSNLVQSTTSVSVVIFDSTVTGPADLQFDSMAQDQITQGTTTNIQAVIRNDGLFEATNVTATLVALNPSFTVNAPASVNTAILAASGGLTTNAFSITASGSASVGIASNAFTLNLSGYGTDGVLTSTVAQVSVEVLASAPPPPPPTGEILFVASDAIGEVVSSTTPTSLTLPGFNAGTANNTYVIVAIATKLEDNTSDPVTSVTFGGAPLTRLAGRGVDDSYDGWAILYGAVADGIGDVVVNYTPNAVEDDILSESVAFSVASYSGVLGTDAVGTGADDPGNPGDIADSITTANNNSLIGVFTSLD